MARIDEWGDFEQQINDKLPNELLRSLRRRLECCGGGELENDEMAVLFQYFVDSGTLPDSLPYQITALCMMMDGAIHGADPVWLDSNSL